MGTEDFLKNQGQTTPYPLLLDIDRAEGSYIYDKSGKAYLDMIAGVAVNNIGHRHPKVIAAIEAQLKRHLHVMVYGEFIQDAPLEMARRLSASLPEQLQNVYPVNSGTEANEAAMKLVKRVTGRTEIVAFEGAYHGSTQGSLSLSSNKEKKQAFTPLLPNIRHIRLNRPEDLRYITKETAGVFLETIQGDAGIRIPTKEFLISLRKQCDEMGALLVFDEIQCGMGRAGSLHAFEQFGIVPDVLTLGKALGGGMPIGALVSSKENLMCFTENPVLGHITTFGGHPLVCAAAAATLDVLQTEIDFKEVEKKAAFLEAELVKIPAIKKIRRQGMMFACDMENAEVVNNLVMNCMKNGLLSFWFLSHPYSFRLSPPLTISMDELKQAVKMIKASL
jgi:acetylornithine/N-succinyldiaminopimelate aminotransferase